MTRRPDNNLPAPSQPWARSVETDLRNLDFGAKKSAQDNKNAFSSINTSLGALGDQIERQRIDLFSKAESISSANLNASFSEEVVFPQIPQADSMLILSRVDVVFTVGAPLANVGKATYSLTLNIYASGGGGGGGFGALPTTIFPTGFSGNASGGGSTTFVYGSSSDDTEYGLECSITPSGLSGNIATGLLSVTVLYFRNTRDI